MKQALGTLCAAFVLLFVYSALSSGPPSSGQAPAPSATPNPFVAQLTSSPFGDPFNRFVSNATDVSANGRFVVVESNGDISTEKIPSKKPDGTPNANARNNEDGNREIFLIDYAQRRIFQITDTKNVPNPTPSPSPTPTMTRKNAPRTAIATRATRRGTMLQTNARSAHLRPKGHEGGSRASRRRI